MENYILKKGMIIMCSKEVLKNFNEENGEGKGDYKDWALCNGMNNTPNLINHFPVGAGDQYSYRDNGGKDKIQLTINQLPSHNHSGSTNQDGAHRHLSQNSARADNDDNDCPNNFITNADVNYYKSSIDIIENGSEHIHKFTTDATGKNEPIENRPPYTALYFIMKIN